MAFARCVSIHFEVLIEGQPAIGVVAIGKACRQALPGFKIVNTYPQPVVPRGHR